MSNKRYKTISEVSEILNINKHVIRYWDSKFPGLSLRLNDNKQRLFNADNIKKLGEIKNLLYQNGQHNYSLDLANKIINKKSRSNDYIKENLKNSSTFKNVQKLEIDVLAKISKNLKELLDL